MKKGIVIIYSMLATVCFAQHTQNIRGTVTDALTHEPIAYATIQLVDDPTQGTVADENGKFSLCCIPVGRHSLRCQFVGYEPAVMNELLLTSAKELFVDFTMNESMNTLEDVVVRPSIVKERTLNRLVTTGGRMFSIEEASRYAGGFDDPARLATSFAGVASGGATNGISIHGNAPHLLAWHLEDIEIPNPNHFSDISVLGGGIFSSLSAMCIGNSDFLTCAFPAEYGNAVSGVFDMKMRNGNDQKYENTLQVGVGGIDIASEGPLNKKNGSSYLANYRYSMTGLANKLHMIDMQGQVMDYQDLNFKLNFPTEKAGTFTFWGTGLIDGFHNEASPNKWKSKSDECYSYSDQYMGASGIGHNITLCHGQLHSSLGYTYSRDELGTDTYILPDGFDFTAKDTKGLDKSPYFRGYRTYTNLTARTSYSHRFGPHWNAQYGVIYTAMLFDVSLREAFIAHQAMHDICVNNGNTCLITAFTTQSFNLSNKTTLNLGLNAQYLALNNANVVEPRTGITYKVNERSSIALAYGLHSRAEKTDIYFTREVPDPTKTGDWNATSSDRLVNKELGFTRSHHLMLTYNYKINEQTSLKVEPYYQKLFDVPVEHGTSYSVLNRQEFYLDKALVNEGEGRNYGVDITLERYLNRGWYGMINGSFFSSRYKGGDDIWRHTAFDRNFIINIMGGKEWMLGHHHNDMLSINIKATYQGGDRYTPIDRDATLAHPDLIAQCDNTRSYSLQRDPMLIVHYTISYKLNRNNKTHEFSIKHINCTGTKSFYGYEYNYHKDTFTPQTFNLSLPNVSYKIEF